MQPLTGLPMLKLTLPDRSVGQRCQVRDFIPRSRDFFKQLGFYWDFYFKNVTSGFFGTLSSKFSSRFFYKTNYLPSDLGFVHLYLHPIEHI